MDVLHPDLLWIEGRCYRKPFIKIDDPGVSGGDTADDYTFEEDELNLSAAACDPLELEEDIEIVAAADGGFKATLDIANAYFAIIVGKQGQTKRQLEVQTGTSIFIPKIGHEGSIIVKGSQRRDVISCCRRILLRIVTAREQQPFTHFLSIPFTAPEIRSSFERFQSEILANHFSANGVDATIFQNPAKLHATLGTLVLLSESERRKADQTLRECLRDVVLPYLEEEGGDLRIELSGIEILKDDPGDVDVLYGKLSVPNSDDPSRLQALFDNMIDYFIRRGTMTRQYARVKLHVTLMNTVFRKPDNIAGGDGQDTGGGWREHQDRESFDANGILKDYNNYYFGVQPVQSVHISQRFGQPGREGYYYATAECRFDDSQ